MMTITYTVLGMTCGSCEAKVKKAFEQLDNVSAVQVSKDANSATVISDKAINFASIQQAIQTLGDKYSVAETQKAVTSTNETTTLSWWSTYKPVLLIFGFITVVTLLIQYASGSFDTMTWMRHFMAGFFLVFSFFKLLNLEGFAQSYAMYDVIAKRIPAWGYVYAFIELGLGLAFIIDYNPLLINIITLVVMSISIIGVLSSVLNKQKIQCACLGDVFNLPMSTVTIIEDGLMIFMSLVMILMYN